MSDPIVPILFTLVKQIEDIKGVLFNTLLKIVPETISTTEDMNFLRYSCVWELHKQGMTYSNIALKMKDSKIPTKQGGEWTRYVVKNIINHLKKEETL